MHLANKQLANKRHRIRVSGRASNLHISCTLVESPGWWVGRQECYSVALFTGSLPGQDISKDPAGVVYI